jgi:hypothetical protein
MADLLDQIIETGLGDYRLLSLGWTGDCDLECCFEPPGTHGLLRLRFIWSMQVRIELDFGPYSGMPLLWESEIALDRENKLYRVRLDFGGAPEGTITLTCNEIHAHEEGAAMEQLS